MNLDKLRLALLALLCFYSGELFAQTPQQIEADLLRSFQKFESLAEKQREDTTGTLKEDDVDKAMDVFAKKLKHYTSINPATITYPFMKLKNMQLLIKSSDDGSFRIYSWDTGGSGTMHEFADVIQYRVGQRTKSVYLCDSTDFANSPYFPFYSNLYTFKVNQKTYYLGIYGCIFSTYNAGTGIKVFDIENGKLNSDVKLFKTASGLHSDIYYDYNFFSVVDIPYENRPTITFDAATLIIRIPLVKENGDVTKKFIIYKFTGQYFERVKS
jgi:hypothetical protein